MQAVERQLKEMIGKRLKPGQRSELLRLARDQFILAFEFGKDWARLRKVDRRKNPPPLSESEPADSDAATQAATDGLTPAAQKPVTPSSGSPPSTLPAPWRAVDTDRFELGDPVVLSVLRSDSHWQLISADHVCLSESVTLEQAVVKAGERLKAELDRLRGEFEFCRLQREVMQSNDDQSALAANEKQALELKADYKRLSELLTALV